MFFKAYHLSLMMPVMVGLVILGGFSGVSTWVIGPVKGLMVAAHDGSLPSFLQKKNAKGVPTRLLLAQAALFTLLSASFVFFDTVSESYWFLSALTAQLAMLTYVLMFAAAFILRLKQPQVKRAFKVPGGLGFLALLCGIGIFTCLGAILIGFVPPEELHIAHQQAFSMSLLVGVIIFIVSGWLLSKRK